MISCENIMDVAHLFGQYNDIVEFKDTFFFFFLRNKI